MKFVLRFLLVSISIIFMLAILLYSKGMLYKYNNYCEIPFVGKGTEKAPYLIQNTEDLKALRDLVNSGESFENIYFLQSSDIDLSGENWIPIGAFGTENYFAGVYDGGAHYISNLSVVRDNDAFPANGGLFGVLDGTVKNLGIESGLIEGDYIGAITSHGTGRALILNCYNKASVTGAGRAGGICDNMGGGTVINCINYGHVEAPVSAQIVSYNARYLIAVYPEEDAYAKTFDGVYIDIPMDGNSIEEQLNAGLDELIGEKIIAEEDILKW